MYELSRELSNDLENEKILARSQNWEDTYSSAQYPLQK